MRSRDSRRVIYRVNIEENIEQQYLLKVEGRCDDGSPRPIKSCLGTRSSCVIAYQALSSSKHRAWGDEARHLANQALQ